MAQKKGIAILGIEAAVGPTGQIDPQDTDMAKQLTKELRDRTKQGQGLYTLVPGGDKELVDEKLMNNCASEAPTCMATIGKNLNAQVLMFGTLKKSNPTNYVVTLKLVHVAGARLLGSKIDVDLPASSKQPDLAKWAKKYYRELTGEDSDGTLQVRVTNLPPNVSATVYIDNDPKGTIQSGSGSTTITLPEGRYRVGIEAEGFRPWASKDPITIEAGKTFPISEALEPKTTPPCPEGETRQEDGTCKSVVISVGGTLSKPGRNMFPFKVVAAASLGLAAVGGVVWAWSWQKHIKPFEQSPQDRPIYLEDGIMTVDGTVLTQEECGDKVYANGLKIAQANDPDLPADNNRNGLFHTACEGHSRTKWAIPVTIGFGVVGVGALLYVVTQKNPVAESRPPGQVGRRKPSRNLSVTPILTPDGGGATLRFDW